VGFSQHQPPGLEHVKEGLRTCQAGDRVDRLRGQRLQCTGLAFGVDGLDSQLPVRHKALATVVLAMGVQQQIDGSGPGFAQRTGRQQPAVARATVIHQADFQIALQGQVLQTIVTDDDLDFGMGLSQLSGGLQP